MFNSTKEIIDFLKNINDNESALHKKLKMDLYYKILNKDIKLLKDRMTFKKEKRDIYESVHLENVFLYRIHNYYVTPEGDIDYRYRIIKDALEDHLQNWTDQKIFVPDIAVVLNNGKHVWIEIKNSHAVSKNKKDFCLFNNISLFEVDCKNYDKRQDVNDLILIHEMEYHNKLIKTMLDIKKNIEENKFILIEEVKYMSEDFRMLRFLLKKYYKIEQAPQYLTEEISIYFKRKSRKNIFCKSSVVKKFEKEHSRQMDIIRSKSQPKINS